MTPEVKALCDIVRETGFEIHCYHNNGYLEKIYENSLVNRLQKKGIHVEQQKPIQVFDEDGTLLGNYLADLFIENSLIIEIKACRALSEEHTAQILGYLRSSRIEHGLLINFGAPKFEIKKFVLSEI
ncbi:MAG: GxxExxY protein [Puniceicoccales bacterium]